MTAPVRKKRERLVAIEALRPNPWNYNVESQAIFQTLVESIREFGFSEPLIVRQEVGVSGYEILGGEHSWRAGLWSTGKQAAVTGTAAEPRARPEGTSSAGDGDPWSSGGY